MTALWTPADDAALDQLIRTRDIFLPQVISISELDPEQAVFEALGALISRLSVVVEGGQSSIEFKSVYTSSPNAWDPAVFPSAAIDDIETHQYQVVQCTPARFHNGDDVIFGKWALWDVGEDVGKAKVTIVAATNPEARALAEAVRQCLFADLNENRSSRLPMPRAFLPDPFRGKVHKFCRVTFIEGGGSIRDTDSPQQGLYRVEVRFSWQAPRISARPVLPFGSSFEITTGST